MQREISQVDKWSDFVKAANQVKWTIDDEYNTPFTYVEVQEIRASVNIAKSRIRTLKLSEDQLHLLDAKLEYIAEKATRFGRIDWKNILVGTLIGTIVQLAVSPETAKEIWSIISEVFKKVLLIALQ